MEPYRAHAFLGASMTVDEALPNVRHNLRHAAFLVSGYRDELADVGERLRANEADATAQRRRQQLTGLIARQTNKGVAILQDDLEAIGRADLKDALTRYARRCLSRRDAITQLDRLFLATDD